ncbi:hypothetical protein PUN4_1120049 [Paraburkholderia unamae]|nr:hypothetical protein PUN4_1120049 [Paraburkholderia unamae]
MVLPREPARRLHGPGVLLMAFFPAGRLADALKHVSAALRRSIRSQTSALTSVTPARSRRA